MQPSGVQAWEVPIAPFYGHVSLPEILALVTSNGRLSEAVCKPQAFDAPEHLGEHAAVLAFAEAGARAAPITSPVRGYAPDGASPGFLCCQAHPQAPPQGPTSKESNMNLAIATPAAATETVRPGVNEKSFFASMKHLFAGSFSTVGELMQNSRRAGASKVSFEFDPAKSTMAVVDDGHGIRDFQALIQLCESSWDEQTMLSDRPFGMGLFSVLFAAREITFRSRGRRLTVTLQDVVEKRALDVHTDAEAPTVGTRIELVDLKPAMLQKQYAVLPYHDDLANLAEYALYNALRERACGFPIPVFINGFEMARPYEQTALKGEVTSIGFVQVPRIHVTPERSIGPLFGRGHMKLLLQGLPIGSMSRGTPEAIVHLDTTSFTARMPDRSALYDHDEACKRIHDTLVQLAKDHLVRQKAALSGRDFVLRHWEDCRQYNLLHLLNDIPWIPREAARAVHTVTNTGDEVHANFTAGVRPDDSDSSLLIAREQVLSGEVVIWRNVPDVPSECRPAALIMKLAQRLNIGALTCALDEDHWLNLCSSDVRDLDFRVEPVGAQGSARLYSGDWAEYVEIQLANQARVDITSKVDPTFNMEVTLNDDWVLLPRDYATEGLSQDEDFANEDAICYLVGGNGAPDLPMDALSTFRDENDDYHGDWRDRAITHWDSVVSGLRGESLANVVASGLSTAASTPSEGHAVHIAIVRTRQRRAHEGALYAPEYSVVDAQRDGFWEEVARELEALGGNEPLGAHLKAAFYAVVKPGEQEP